MKEQWRKSLEWMKMHKLICVLVGILIVLAVYCAIVRPALSKPMEEVSSSEPTETEKERPTDEVLMETDDVVQTMESYVEYFCEDGGLMAEYATGEWESRLVYKENGTTSVADNSNEKTLGPTATMTDEYTTTAVTTADTPEPAPSKIEATTAASSITEVTMTAGTTVATQATAVTTTATSTVANLTTASTTVGDTTEAVTTKASTEDPFLAAGWKKKGEDDFFKYYTNGTWNIGWCFQDYGGGDFDEVMVKEYLGTSKTVIVPERIAGKVVSSMSDTFLDSTIQFSSITIPKTIREMYGVFGRAYYVGRIVFELGSNLNYVDSRSFGGTHQGGDNWEKLTTIQCEAAVRSLIVDGYYVQEGDFIFQITE